MIYWFGGRVPRDGQAIGIAFAVDQAGGGFATVIGGLFAAALVFAWGYFNEVHAHFHVLMLVFMTGMIGFCLTHGVFNMFVWFESPTDEEREKNDWPLWLMLLPALALLAWSCVDAAGAGRIAPSAAATLMPPGAVAGPASPQTAIPVAVLAWLSVGLALLLAACQLSWRHLPGWLVGNVQRVLNPLGAGLRFLHDGAVGDYIAWAVVSLALLTAAFGLS